MFRNENDIKPLNHAWFGWFNKASVEFREIKGMSNRCRQAVCESCKDSMKVDKLILVVELHPEQKPAAQVSGLAERGTVLNSLLAYDCIK